MSPVSIRRSEPSTRQRVTSQETTPSATIAPVTPRSTEWPEPDAASREQGGHEDDDQCDQRPAAADDRRERVQPVPDTVVDRRGRLGAHRPAAFASPSAASWSRRRAASAALRPGMRASLAAAAVCIRTVASPNDRSTGPRGHVDELHAAVRDDGESREHHAATNEQVVFSLAIGPRPHAALGKAFRDDRRLRAPPPPRSPPATCRRGSRRRRRPRLSLRSVVPATWSRRTSRRRGEGRCHVVRLVFVSRHERRVCPEIASTARPRRRMGERTARCGSPWSEESG